METYLGEPEGPRSETEEDERQKENQNLAILMKSAVQSALSKRRQAWREG